jgi:hypothetical protein
METEITAQKLERVLAHAEAILRARGAFTEAQIARLKRKVALKALSQKPHCHGIGSRLGRSGPPWCGTSIGLGS